jgi:hypothetical protein
MHISQNMACYLYKMANFIIVSCIKKIQEMTQKSKASRELNVIVFCLLDLFNIFVSPFI